MMIFSFCVCFFFWETFLEIYSLLLFDVLHINLIENFWSIFNQFILFEKKIFGHKKKFLKTYFTGKFSSLFFRENFFVGKINVFFFGLSFSNKKQQKIIKIMISRKKIQVILDQSINTNHH